MTPERMWEQENQTPKTEKSDGINIDLSKWKITVNDGKLTKEEIKFIENLITKDKEWILKSSKEWLKKLKEDIISELNSRLERKWTEKAKRYIRWLKDKTENVLNNAIWKEEKPENQTTENWDEKIVEATAATPEQIEADAQIKAEQNKEKTDSVVNNVVESAVTTAQIVNESEFQSQEWTENKTDDSTEKTNSQTEESKEQTEWEKNPDLETAITEFWLTEEEIAKVNWDEKLQESLLKYYNEFKNSTDINFRQTQINNFKITLK